MSAFSFDKQKYIEILKTQGISAALTTLHQDTQSWEVESFEGPKGYQPDSWKKIDQVRDFSRELWEMALQKEP